MMYFIFLILALGASLFTGCATGNVEPKFEVVEVFDSDSTLVERSHYKDGKLDGNRWLNFDDTMNVSQTWEQGNLISADTFYVSLPDTVPISPTEGMLVDWTRTVSFYGAKGLASVAAGGKYVAEKAPEAGKSLSKLVSSGGSLVGDLFESAGIDRSYAADVANAVAEGSEKMVKVVGGYMGQIPVADSNLVFAFSAGFVRGFSVGYHETKDGIVAVVEWVPEAASAVANTTLSEAYDGAKAHVADAVKNVSPYLTVDSVSVIMEMGRKKLEQVPGLAEELVFMFQVEIDEAMKVWNVDPSNRSVFIAGYVMGWVGWNVLVYEVLNTTWHVAAAAKGAFTGNSPRKVADFAARMNRSRSVKNPDLAARSFREPVSGTRGHWFNEKTKNVWRSDIPEVNAITKGKGVHFTGPANNRMPDFTDWSRGTYKFKKGELIGYDEPDFEKLYEKIAARKGISKGEARRFIQRNGLTPHHSACNEIQLVPSALHNGVPHTGAASMIRNGLCPI